MLGRTPERRQKRRQRGRGEQRHPWLAACVAAGVLGLVAVPAAARAGTADASCMASAINDARAAAGLAPLALNGNLASIASAHSQDMAAAGSLSHNPDLRSQAPSDWVSLGENVGDGPSCSSVAVAFMGDADHRQNILDASFSQVGVGAVTDASGTIWFTEDFMGTGGSAAPAPVPPPSVPKSVLVSGPGPHHTTAPAPQPEAPAVPAVTKVPAPVPAPATAPGPAPTTPPAAVPLVSASPSASPVPFASGSGSASAATLRTHASPAGAGKPGKSHGARRGHHRGLFAWLLGAVGSVFSTMVRAL